MIYIFRMSTLIYIYIYNGEIRYLYIFRTLTSGYIISLIEFWHLVPPFLRAHIFERDKVRKVFWIILKNLGMLKKLLEERGETAFKNWQIANRKCIMGASPYTSNYLSCTPKTNIFLCLPMVKNKSYSLSLFLSPHTPLHPQNAPQ